MKLSQVVVGWCAGSLAGALSLASTGALAGDASAKLGHAPPAFTQGADVRFEATLPDGVQASMLLLFRRAGEPEFQNESMKKMPGPQGTAQYVAVLPWTRTGGDLEYYLQAFYGAGLGSEVSWASAERPQALRLPKPAAAAPAKPPVIKAVPVEAVAPPAAAAKPAGVRERNFTPGVLFLSAGLAAGCAGVALGLGATSAADELAGQKTPEQYASKLADAQGKAKTATAAWVAAGVLAAAGVALLVYQF